MRIMCFAVDGMLADTCSDPVTPNRSASSNRTFPGTPVRKSPSHPPRTTLGGSLMRPTRMNPFSLLLLARTRPRYLIPMTRSPSRPFSWHSYSLSQPSAPYGLTSRTPVPVLNITCSVPATFLIGWLIMMLINQVCRLSSRDSPFPPWPVDFQSPGVSPHLLPQRNGHVCSETTDQSGMSIPTSGSHPLLLVGNDVSPSPMAHPYPDRLISRTSRQLWYVNFYFPPSFSAGITQR